MVYGIWYMVCGICYVWYMVYVIWCMVHCIWYKVHVGIWYMVCGILVPAVVFEFEELEKFGVLLSLLRRDVLSVPLQQIQHLEERLLIHCQQLASALHMPSVGTGGAMHQVARAVEKAGKFAEGVFDKVVRDAGGLGCCRRTARARRRGSARTCPPRCATDCTPCPQLLRNFPGWILSPPPSAPGTQEYSSTPASYWEVQNATFCFVVIHECAFPEFTTRGNRLLACFPGEDQFYTCLCSTMQFPFVT